MLSTVVCASPNQFESFVSSSSPGCPWLVSPSTPSMFVAVGAVNIQAHASKFAFNTRSVVYSFKNLHLIFLLPFFFFFNGRNATNVLRHETHSGGSLSISFLNIAIIYWLYGKVPRWQLHLICHENMQINRDGT